MDKVVAAPQCPHRDRDRRYLAGLPPRDLFANRVGAFFSAVAISCRSRVFRRLALGGGIESDFDELCASGFALIGIDVDPVTLRKIALLPLWTKVKPSLLNVRLAASTRKSDLVVEDDRQKRLLAPYSGEVLIVRPDRYVAAAAPAHDMLHEAEFFGRQVGLSRNDEQVASGAA